MNFWIFFIQFYSFLWKELPVLCSFEIFWWFYRSYKFQHLIKSWALKIDRSGLVLLFDRILKRCIREEEKIDRCHDYIFIGKLQSVTACPSLRNTYKRSLADLITSDYSQPKASLSDWTLNLSILSSDHSATDLH